jgi:hypothetical protein
MFLFVNVHGCGTVVMSHNTIQYFLTDQSLYQALSRYSIKGKRVLVIGSESPVFEAIALSYGAAEVRHRLHSAPNCPH